MSISEKHLETIRRVVSKHGLAPIARRLGVGRNGLASVLIGRAQQSTQKAVADAYVMKARELETL